MNFLTRAKLHAPHFLTEKKSISQFLILVATIAVIFWIIYKPIGIMAGQAALGGNTLPLYTAILVTSGIVIIALSRILLYNVIKKKDLQLSGFLAWIIGEWIIIIAAVAVLAQLINTNEELTIGTIITRSTLFVTAILAIPYIVSILLFQIREKQMEIEALKAMLSEQKAHPLIPADGMINFYDKSGHLVFGTKKKNLLYITANDNYTNIYFLNEGKTDCFIHHTSMKQVEEAYESQGLVRCHRGYLVNTENVKFLHKENDSLVLELIGSDTTIPVSKTYIDKVTHHFAGRS